MYYKCVKSKLLLCPYPCFISFLAENALNTLMHSAWHAVTVIFIMQYSHADNECGTIHRNVLRSEVPQSNYHHRDLLM